MLTSTLPALLKKGEQGLGRSRGGWTTKIHVCVEGLGQPARCILTGGQVHDVTQAQPLLEPIPAEAVVADKAFDADTLFDCINRKTAKAIIAPKASRKEQRPFDQYQCRNRHVVERFFARRKPFRRIATRYEKLASRFASFVALVAVFLWLISVANFCG